MKNYYAGQDLAKRFDYSVLVIVAVENAKAKVQAVKSWPHVNYSVIFKETHLAYAKYNWKMLAVDQGNVGEYAIEEYRKRGIRFEGVKFTAAKKHAMIQLLVMLLQEKRLTLPLNGLEELKSQIMEQERVIRANEYPLYRQPENRHDDQLWALCLALTAAERELVQMRSIINVNAKTPRKDYFNGYGTDLSDVISHGR